MFIPFKDTPEGKLIQRANELRHLYEKGLLRQGGEGREAAVRIAEAERLERLVYCPEPRQGPKCPELSASRSLSDWEIVEGHPLRHPNGTLSDTPSTTMTHKTFGIVVKNSGGMGRGEWYMNWPAAKIEHAWVSVADVEDLSAVVEKALCVAYSAIRHSNDRELSRFSKRLGVRDNWKEFYGR